MCAHFEKKTFFFLLLIKDSKDKKEEENEEEDDMPEELRKFLISTGQLKTKKRKVEEFVWDVSVGKYLLYVLTTYLNYSTPYYSIDHSVKFQSSG